MFYLVDFKQIKVERHFCTPRSEFGTDVSGQFFASAQGKFTGPIEAQLQPHLQDGANQEAAWQAVVNVSGVDLP